MKQAEQIKQSIFFNLTQSGSHIPDLVKDSMYNKKVTKKVLIELLKDYRYYHHRLFGMTVAEKVEYILKRQFNDALLCGLVLLQSIIIASLIVYILVP